MDWMLRLGLVAVLVVLVTLAVTVGRSSVRRAPPPAPVEAGLLTGFDLDDGTYALVVALGGGAEPLRIDDQALIAAHRGAIDIGFSFVDFLPGEGRGGIYLFAFRDGELVAGRVVSLRSQIRVPDEVLAAGRPVERFRLDANRAEILPAAARLAAEGVLRDTGGLPGPADEGPEFSFIVQLPTVAVEADAEFDADAYAGQVAERIRSRLDGLVFELEVVAAQARPPGTVLLTDGGWGVLRDPDGEPLRLDGVALHDLRVHVRGDAAVHEAFSEIELDALVADRRGQDLVVAAWMAATGTAEAPAEIFLDAYESGSMSGLLERSYTILYWR